MPKVELTKREPLDSALYMIEQIQIALDNEDKSLEVRVASARILLTSVAGFVEQGKKEHVQVPSNEQGEEPST